MASRRELLRLGRRIGSGGLRPETRFQEREEVDFVIVGSGSAGGIVAKELSTAGHSVVVLEQGPYRRDADFEHHDDLEGFLRPEQSLTGSPADDPQSFRTSEDEEASAGSYYGFQPVFYARGVGGSSVHFTANFWRFHPVDFRERSLLGDIPGTGFADWPITYDELEPYYTKVDWEIGVSASPDRSIRRARAPIRCRRCRRSRPARSSTGAAARSA